MSDRPALLTRIRTALSGPTGTLVSGRRLPRLFPCPEDPSAPTSEQPAAPPRDGRR